MGTRVKKKNTYVVLTWIRRLLFKAVLSSFCCHWQPKDIPTAYFVTNNKIPIILTQFKRRCPRPGWRLSRQSFVSGREAREIFIYLFIYFHNYRIITWLNDVPRRHCFPRALCAYKSEMSSLKGQRCYQSAWRRYRSAGPAVVCLSKKNDIWLVRAWIEAGADKQMDLLCLECSPGELDGPRYRDAALCVCASMKNNKTLWGMNQIQSDRDTKAHMLIHSISRYLCLCFPFTFFPHRPPPRRLTCLSLLLPF